MMKIQEILCQWSVLVVNNAHSWNCENKWKF